MQHVQILPQCYELSLFLPIYRVALAAKQAFRWWFSGCHDHSCESCKLHKSPFSQMSLGWNSMFRSELHTSVFVVLYQNTLVVMRLVSSEAFWTGTIRVRVTITKELAVTRSLSTYSGCLCWHILWIFQCSQWFELGHTLQKWQYIYILK